MSGDVVSIRKDVAISGYNRTLAPTSSFFFLTPAQTLDIFFENALGTDELYSNMDAAALPGDELLYENVLGNLVNISILTQQAGLEVYVHEGIHNGTGSWMYSDGFIVTPGLAAHERGFRIGMPAVRVRLLNASASLNISGDLGVRVSTQ